jgi:N-acetylmuramoyl-L-alanine amidase
MGSDPALTRRLLLGHGCGAALLAPGAALAGRAPLRHGRPAPRVVVIDPGHGGKDPGAIGVSGTYEKHIAYAAAEALARRLNASGRYRAQLTRERDEFLPLEQRVACAQAHGAALFVSIHADAIGNPVVRGASVYVGAEHASDGESAALAERENAADRFAAPGRLRDPGVSRILASLARQETRLSSAELQAQAVRTLGKSTPMLPNPARHADFAVLRSPEIPSILVEMGFLSNGLDEAALRQTHHRAAIVASLESAIDGYFAANHRLVTLPG